MILKEKLAFPDSLTAPRYRLCKRARHMLAFLKTSFQINELVPSKATVLLRSIIMNSGMFENGF